MKSKELNSFMLKHKLTANNVAELLGVSVFTVNSWRSKSHNHSNIPKPMFELLELKLQQ